MKLMYKIESVLIVILSVLFSILILKLFSRLRFNLPWRVNCWFCNNNFWVKFFERNSWTCPVCEQYNGFTKDGDYNKHIFGTNDQGVVTPKIFHGSPPKNGLCKMCNINQQLKVAQLANFVPMNEANYDAEIEGYRIQLEKAYKLCSPCKKVLQMKLHKEKETLLGYKLLETRTPEKRRRQDDNDNQLKSFINTTSMYTATVLIVLVGYELYKNAERNKNLTHTIANIQNILTDLFGRICTIIKMKLLMTFPEMEVYINKINFNLDTSELSITSQTLGHINSLTQQTLGGIVCMIQIVGHVWNVNKLKHTILIDLLWSVFVMTSMAHRAIHIEPTIISLVKLSSSMAVLLVYKSIKSKTIRPKARLASSPVAMKNLKSKPNSTMEEDTLAIDTDDDVSLCKYGLNNISESSNETINPLMNSLLKGRSFTPQSREGLWTKPKLNSTFCANSVISKSPSSITDTLFVKPTFNKYQNLDKEDSDSDLDESISSLCIGSPNKSKKGNDSVFTLRKFAATPNFVAPTPLSRARPLISPSKLGHGTSWVAGGYWGGEAERQVLTGTGSRSSSQSSGFESHASSINQRNLFSQPSSREESVCGEPDNPNLVDRLQNCNMNNFNIQTPQNFSRFSSPVFPQMQFNGHVHIPQPRFAHQNVMQTAFIQQRSYAQNTFKTPGGSGLIKLPQINSFSSR